MNIPPSAPIFLEIPAKRRTPPAPDSPDAGQDCAVFARRLATTSAGCLRLSLGDQQQAASVQPGASRQWLGRVDSCIQTLPNEMLSLLLARMPLAEHDFCEHVCQRWYHCLPATRERLGHALGQTSPAPGEPETHRSADESLQMETSQSAGEVADEEVLTPRARQHRALLNQQTLLQQKRLSLLDNAQSTEHKMQMYRLLTELEHYAHNLVYQPGTEARPLLQNPVAITPVLAYRIGPHALSPCGRWLAVGHYSSPDSLARLRIYGWNCTGGQEQTLVPAPDKPFTASLAFSRTESDTLFGAEDRNVCIWRRATHTGDWNRTQLHELQSPWNIWYVNAMNNGDLVAIGAREEIADRRSNQLLFFRYQGAGLGWRQPESHFYDSTSNWTRLTTPLAVSRPTGQLALGLHKPITGFYFDCRNRPQIHIWHRTPDAGRASQWKCQESVLDHRDSCIDQISYSPDGQHLLVLFGNKDLWLLAQDEQHSLHKLLALRCNASPYGQHLESVACFAQEGTKLAVPACPREIQVCERDEDGSWKCTGSLKTPLEAGTLEGEKLSCIRLSGSGRILASASNNRVSIWHHDDANRWHRVVERKNHDYSVFPPAIAILGQDAGEEVASTAEDPLLSLCIHGLDSQGQLVQKDAMLTDTPLKGWGASAPDGRSLLFAADKGPGFLMQLGSSSQQRREERESCEAAAS